VTSSRGERALFESAFVATSYVLGRRGAELLAPLVDPTAATRELAERLAAAEREARARALARPLGAITAALEARRLA
jgi:hypothetical protein